MRVRTIVSAVAIAFLSAQPLFGQAIQLNPLQDAYWRFENGTAGQPVPTPNPNGENPDDVLDSANDNHMRTWFALSAPVYTTDVPVDVIPQTGLPNALALRFTPNQDVYTAGKSINNPIVTEFTLEAAFKPEALNLWQAIVCKDGQPTTAPETTLVLKVRAGAPEDPLLNKLQVELFDRGGTRRNIESISPLEVNKWYYAAIVGTETQLSLYLDRVDGQGYVLQGTAEIGGGGPLWQGPGGAGDDRAWVIGRGMYGNGVTDWFTGVIDEVRLTNKALAVADFLFSDGGAPGDFDRDGDVDLDDLIVFSHCATGPEISYAGGLPAGCTLTPNQFTGVLPADFDEDMDVDMVDFGAFQRYIAD